MARQKYKYNPETLSYVKVEYSIREKLFRGVIFTSIFLLAAVILSFGLSYVYDSPRELSEKQEYNRMKTQYLIKNLKQQKIF